MNVFEQVMQVPYAYTAVPVLVFLAIAGGCYWVMCGSNPNASGDAEAESVATEQAGLSIQLAEKPKNLRVAARRQGNSIDVYVAPPERKKSPFTGSVVDRSLGGLRLVLHHEVAVDSVLAVRPVEADAMVPWVEIRIRSCKASVETPGQYEVGCEYVKSPPYSIQLLFG